MKNEREYEGRRVGIGTRSREGEGKEGGGVREEEEEEKEGGLQQKTL